MVLTSKLSKSIYIITKILKFYKKSPKEIGLAFGYPQSAYEAFVKEKLTIKDIFSKVISEEEKKRILKEKTFGFIFFRFSSNNWQEELNIVRRWQKLIKEKSPKLYEEVLKKKAKLIKWLKDN